MLHIGYSRRSPEAGDHIVVGDHQRNDALQNGRVIVGE
jgi:hypothetical protein